MNKIQEYALRLQNNKVKEENKIIELSNEITKIIDLDPKSVDYGFEYHIRQYTIKRESRHIGGKWQEVFEVTYQKRPCEMEELNNFFKLLKKEVNYQDENNIIKKWWQI